MDTKTEYVKVMKTKAGKGFKLVVGDKWFYTSIKEMVGMIKGAQAVTFRPITEKPVVIEDARIEQMKEIAAGVPQ